MNLIGKVLSSRYEILEQIGVGGMAYVYKAKCKLLNRYVAVKVLKEEYAKDDIFVKRFRTEAQAAASLTHPNIVSVYDVGKEDGINYIVMELLESRTLKDYVEEKGPLNVDEIYKISIQIASALEAAHKQHIIHRDIKPQNIVLSKNLVAKVTDFGIAKATSTATITNFGTTMGSVHYFSPEHAKGGYTDEKSDIYSLGVVMYEMATGRVPFDSDSPVSVALKHIQEIPQEPKDVNSKITDTLNNIIMKAMAKNTANRFKSASEFLEALHDGNSKRETKKFESAVGVGKTQVLTVITDEMLENAEGQVPNLRTRGIRRGSVSESQNASSNVVERKRIRSNYEKNDVLMNESSYNLNKEKKEKKKVNSNKVMIIISIVLILLALAIAGFFIIKIARNAANVNQIVEIEIPNVLGKTIEEINNEYASLGITVEQTKIEYSADYPEGKVISQSPVAGSKSKTKKIYVVVSRGQNLVTVPNFKDKDIKVARYELENTLGFKVQIEYEKSEEVVSGNVISQSIEAGTEAPAGSTITLKVSEGDGKAKVLMPQLVGKTKDEAVKALEDLKLVVQTETGEDKTKSNGVVIAQGYLQNYELKEGDVVTITVNRVQTSKTIIVDVQSLLTSAGVSTKVPTTTKIEKDEDGNETKVEVEGEVPNATITIKASVDGGATNTCATLTVKVTDKTSQFTINGYSTAILEYYVNSSATPAKKETIMF